MADDCRVRPQTGKIGQATKGPRLTPIMAKEVDEEVETDDKEAIEEEEEEQDSQEIGNGSSSSNSWSKVTLHWNVSDSATDVPAPARDDYFLADTQRRRRRPVPSPHYDKGSPSGPESATATPAITSGAATRWPAWHVCLGPQQQSVWGDVRQFQHVTFLTLGTGHCPGGSDSIHHDSGGIS